MIFQTRIVAYVSIAVAIFSANLVSASFVQEKWDFIWKNWGSGSLITPFINSVVSKVCS